MPLRRIKLHETVSPIRLTEITGLFEHSNDIHKGKYYPYGCQVACSRNYLRDYGTGIPYCEVEALARVLLPEIQAFFESEEGQREYAEWKAQRQAKQENKA